MSKVNTVGWRGLKWLKRQRMACADAISRALNYSRVREISRRVLMARAGRGAIFRTKAALVKWHSACCLQP